MLNNGDDNLVDGWFLEKSDAAFDRWDQELVNSGRYNFLQLSYRMRSYEAYSQRSELIVYKVNGTIVFGSCNLILKKWPFTVYLCPGGVYYSPDLSSEDLALLARQYFKIVKEHARRNGFNLIQMSIPKELKVPGDYRKQRVFKQVPSFGEINAIKIPCEGDVSRKRDFLIASFNKSGRRDVRYSLATGVEVEAISDIDDWEEAYEMISENALRKGYSVRSWEKFGTFLEQGFNLGVAIMLSAKFEGKIVGAVLLERSGDTLNYTMGGHMRLNPDKYIGYRLLMEAMLYCGKRNIPTFNISAGGPLEVRQFKKKFNPTLVILNDTYFAPVDSWLSKVLLAVLFVHNKSWSRKSKN